MNKAIIACVSLFIILGLCIGGGFVGANATETKKKQGECYECWYQYNITVASLMFILALLAFACCTIALLSDRWMPAMPNKVEAMNPFKVPDILRPNDQSQIMQQIQNLQQQLKYAQAG